MSEKCADVIVGEVCWCNCRRSVLM